MASQKYVRKTITLDGRRYEVRGKTEAEAVEKLSALLAAAKEGRIITDSTMQVDAWFRQWKAVYKDNSGIIQKSLMVYDEKYWKYLHPAIGHMRLRDVRDIQLQSILNSQAGKSFSHVTKLRMVMQEMFRQAYRSRLIRFDPSVDLRLPMNVKKSYRSITEEERAHILEVAQDHPSGLWVLIILYAGLRPGEAAALQWKDIDFENNEIHVYKAVESGSARIKSPKTQAGIRDIPMRQELRYRLLKERGKPFEYLFPNRDGNVRSQFSVRRLWMSFAKALDIHMGATTEGNTVVKHAIAPDLTLYCLRHTFCTDLQRAGVEINIAKELMGHSSISVTADIYTHRDQTVLHKNIIKLDTFDQQNRERTIQHTTITCGNMCGISSNKQS